MCQLRRLCRQSFWVLSVYSWYQAVLLRIRPRSIRDRLDGFSFPTYDFTKKGWKWTEPDLAGRRRSAASSQVSAMPLTNVFQLGHALCVHNGVRQLLLGSLPAWLTAWEMLHGKFLVILVVTVGYKIFAASFEGFLPAYSLPFGNKKNHALIIRPLNYELHKCLSLLPFDILRFGLCLWYQAWNHTSFNESLPYKCTDMGVHTYSKKSPCNIKVFLF